MIDPQIVLNNTGKVLVEHPVALSVDKSRITCKGTVKLLDFSEHTPNNKPLFVLRTHIFVDSSYKLGDLSSKTKSKILAFECTIDTNSFDINELYRYKQEVLIDTAYAAMFYHLDSEGKLTSHELAAFQNIYEKTQAVQEIGNYLRKKLPKQFKHIPSSAPNPVLDGCVTFHADELTHMFKILAYQTLSMLNNYKKAQSKIEVH